ncbi:MAG: FCD domain-containing protein [Anaerolineae bacterium]|nr:FCD domain-containing protein [Anaerolineae bacterium]
MSLHLQRSTLVHSVTEQLRQMILSGEVRPGEYLPSRKELAARFGVGISTVHEAIQALTALGLVASHPGKGTWVREDALERLIQPAEFERRMGELDAQMVYEARSVIEVALTELAAERAMPEDVERIWNALAAMEEAGQDTVAFVEADLDFHQAVASAAKSGLLEQLYYLSRRLLSKAITDLVVRPGVREESIRIQRSIAEAIEQREPDQAREAARDHMEYIGRLLEAS